MAIASDTGVPCASAACANFIGAAQRTPTDGNGRQGSTKIKDQVRDEETYTLTLTLTLVM